jgi:hypothetical protein
MFTAAETTALGSFLVGDYRRYFGAGEGRRAELTEAAARLAIECLANSDALYHTFEHTLLVTLAGRDILRGRVLREQTSADDWLLSETQSQLTKLGVVLDAAFSVRNPEKLIEIVGEAVKQGHKFIIVGGGDGTISSVVDHFANTRLLFGVLPLGTANSFARTLGIPVNLEGAIDVLINGKVADVYLGKINEDYFANHRIASGGR